VTARLRRGQAVTLIEEIDVKVITELLIEGRGVELLVSLDAWRVLVTDPTWQARIEQRPDGVTYGWFRIRVVIRDQPGGVWFEVSHR